MKASELEDTELLETGTLLDPLVGGLPRRAITEVWGNWSSGKTTLCLQIVAHAQQQKLKCLWAAVEGYNPKYAAALGVDNSKLDIIVGKCAEDILNELYKAFESEKYDIIFLDSLGALTPRDEMEKEIGVGFQTGQSRLVAGLMRKVAPLHLMGNQTALVFINQSRINFTTGRDEPRGGEAMAFFRSVSVRLQPNGKPVKSGAEVIGKGIKATVIKDKIGGNEKRVLHVPLIFGSGFSAAENLLEEALRKGVITKSGNTYWVSDTKLGTIGKVREWLKEESNYEQIKNLV